MDRVYEFNMGPEEKPLRVDAWLAGKLKTASRTYIQKLILQNMVSVNGRPVKSNHKLYSGDVVKVIIPPPENVDLEPEDIPLDVLYEDDCIIVVNKPKGMVVHPAPGNYRRTLVNALLYHCKNLSGINGKLRPGIVHRIDKDTSGVLVAAKTDEAHRNLAKQFKAHSVARRYTALVHGEIHEGSGSIDAPIGRHPVERKKMAVVRKNSKTAKTFFKVLERFNGFSLIEASLSTGRTHQIRVHMAFIGHPVVGDPVYAGKRPDLGLKSQALHAGVLGFDHPETGEYMEFTAPIPRDFEAALEKLRACRGAGFIKGEN